MNRIPNSVIYILLQSLNPLVGISVNKRSEDLWSILLKMRGRHVFAPLEDHNNETDS